MEKKYRWKRDLYQEVIIYDIKITKKTKRFIK